MGTLLFISDEARKQYLAQINQIQESAMARAMSDQPHTVYGLVDPRTQEVRWVGCTSNVDRRYRKHICDNDKSNPTKQAWIDGLKANGLLPLLVIFADNLVKKDALIRETYLLQWHVRHGSPLTNIRDVDICAEELWEEVPEWAPMPRVIAL